MRKKYFFIIIFCLQLNTPILALPATTAVNYYAKFNSIAGLSASGIFLVSALINSGAYFLGLHANVINNESELVPLTTNRYVRDTLKNFGYEESFVNSLKICHAKQSLDPQETPFFTQVDNYEQPYNYMGYKNPVNGQNIIFIPKQLDPAIQHFYQNNKNLTEHEKWLLSLAPYQVIQSTEQLVQRNEEKAALSYLLFGFLVQGLSYKAGQLGNSVALKILPEKGAKQEKVQNITHVVKGLLKPTVGLTTKYVALSAIFLSYCQYLQKEADQAAAEKLCNYPGFLKAKIADYKRYDDLITKKKNTYNRDISLFEHYYQRAPYYRAKTLQAVLEKSKTKRK